MIRFHNRDPHSPLELSFEIRDVLHREVSEFQEITVVENPHFGRMMLLDGSLQYTERDEFFYHEMLVHVAMHAHPSPASVGVIGGGDGAAVREILKHSCVTSVQVAEIDERIVAVARQFLSGSSQAFEDPRVRLRVMDGSEFVRRSDLKLDVLLVDAADLTGFEGNLFTEEFYRACSDCLGEDGILIAHTGSLHFASSRLVETQRRLKAVFPVVDLFTSSIPSYPGSWWTFSGAARRHDMRTLRRPFDIRTRYYAPDVHNHAFLPASLYERLMKDGLD